LIEEKRAVATIFAFRLAFVDWAISPSGGEL